MSASGGPACRGRSCARAWAPSASASAWAACARRSALTSALLGWGAASASAAGASRREAAGASSRLRGSSPRLAAGKRRICFDVCASSRQPLLHVPIVHHSTPVKSL
ncbi:MAG: hypothetical protein J3K34DRAFT_517949 [Monoraphidium minutum]|nr:MAG: hypothetical protein J3K34DRAFT_517949 [Monoraphidium minutum]